MVLLGVEDAAVPVTVVATDVLAQERKPLPIIEEFVLRFVDAGVGEVDRISEMLGLAGDQVLEASAIQVSESNIRRNRASGGLALTPQGREVVSDLAATQPVLKQLPVVFDRLIWRLVDYPRSTLLLKKDAQDRGLTLLPSAQNARIGLQDVTAEGFNALIKARDGRAKQIEILRVRKVSPNTHRYAPVQLLVYGDPSRGDLELAVCLEGELMPEHGMALERIKAVDRLGLSVGLAEPRPVLDAALESVRVSAEDMEIAPLASVPGAAVRASDVAPAEASVRSVSVFEHPDLLTKALKGARRRLLIISPWVKAAVVTTDFVSKLEQRLRAGVVVTIAHGYGDNDSGSDEYALKRLHNLATRFSNNFDLVRLKNTHAKILIFDDQWVNTSFNWLSFRGDSDRTYRMEEGTLVKIPESVNEAYENYLAMIREQRM
ncbi:hypothetical protein ACHIPZ_03590 [Antrihabitans sp. NCIMB 15449]|uniref:Phospholipase D-like domain-containing protein n=1 Tax=Antrihabitans spumae TaxID=3373370 RepID=A0ABW7JI32_9NOCA